MSLDLSVASLVRASSGLLMAGAGRAHAVYAEVGREMSALWGVP